MDLPERPPRPELTPMPLEELQRSYRSLRAMFHVVLFILLILTASLALYLLREVSFVRGQVRELTQFVSNYDKNSKPAMQDFLNKLQAFARTNPDFSPILTKFYNPTNPAVAISSTNVFQGDDSVSPARMPPAMPPK
jgi:hypothetical protein